MSKIDADVMKNDKMVGKRLASVNIKDCERNSLGCARQLSHYVCKDRYNDEKRKLACMCGVNMIVSPETAKYSSECKALK